MMNKYLKTLLTKLTLQAIECRKEGLIQRAIYFEQQVDEICRDVGEEAENLVQQIQDENI